MSQPTIIRKDYTLDQVVAALARDAMIDRECSDTQVGTEAQMLLFRDQNQQVVSARIEVVVHSTNQGES